MKLKLKERHKQKFFRHIMRKLDIHCKTSREKNGRQRKILQQTDQVAQDRKGN